MSARVVVGVIGLWLLVAIVWASQTVLGTTLQGNPTPSSTALRMALLQSLPWIPITLAIIALVRRFPITRSTWRRSLLIHVLAFPVLVYAQNVLVVVGFAVTQGRAPVVAEVLRSAGMWSLIRLHVAALAYAAIAALTQGVAYYRDSRARELHMARLEGQLTRARLDALTAQIRPHFLFNTLHTIGHLWRSGHADEADAMLDRLGALFQRVRQSTSRTLVNLDEELEMVGDYLGIEAARFRDRLRVDVRADEEARACAVPPLLLQPLVENAVRHGIASSSSAGRVVVSARRDGDRLRLEVFDDGPGFRNATAPGGSGTGLANTRQRLEQLFGSEQRLDIRSENGAGTTVIIEMPVRHVHDDPADTRVRAAVQPS